MKDFVLCSGNFCTFCIILVLQGSLVNMWSCCGAYMIVAKSNLDNLAASSCCRALTMHGDYGWNNNWQPLIPLVQVHLIHRFNQQMIAIVPTEALEMVKKHVKIPYLCREFWCFSPRWWEVSYPLHTNSIDRLCTQPYHNTVYWKSNKSSAYYCVPFNCNNSR